MKKAFSDWSLIWESRHLACNVFVAGFMGKLGLWNVIKRNLDFEGFGIRISVFLTER